METLTEPQPITLPTRKPWLFTKENAQAMGQRAAAIKAHRSKNPPQPQATPIESPSAPSVVSDYYRQSQIASARKHVRMASERLETALQDPNAAGKDIQALAVALDRLSERERKLSGRPDPGVLKPQAERRSRQPVSLPEPT